MPARIWELQPSPVSPFGRTIASIARTAEARRGDGDLHRPTKAKVSYYWFATARLAARLAVKLQPVDDLVDHLALGSHGDADQIEVGTRDCFHHLAVGSIMRG